MLDHPWSQALWPPYGLLNLEGASRNSFSDKLHNCFPTSERSNPLPPAPTPGLVLWGGDPPGLGPKDPSFPQGLTTFFCFFFHSSSENETNLDYCLWL